ncbi:MAG: hypothetical protein ACQETH_13435, partial [Candidatus Rifleibacteriota bacterium]
MSVETVSKHLDCFTSASLSTSTSTSLNDYIVVNWWFRLTLNHQNATLFYKEFIVADRELLGMF